MGFRLSRCWLSVLKNTCKLHSEMVLLLHIRLRIFFDLTGTEGKDCSKTSIYHKFGCHLYLLQHDSTLKKTLHSNVFFEKWNDTEKPKKNLRKESWQRTIGTTKWDKLGQVGVVGQVGQGERGLQILVGQVEQGEGGLQIFVGAVWWHDPWQMRSHRVTHGVFASACWEANACDREKSIWSVTTWLDLLGVCLGLILTRVCAPPEEQD